MMRFCRKKENFAQFWSQNIPSYASQHVPQALNVLNKKGLAIYNKQQKLSLLVL